MSIIKVRTANPGLLDDTLRQLLGCQAAVIPGTYVNGICEVHVISGLDFLKFALEKQGYGEVVL